jgi:hypothetical protein
MKNRLLLFLAVLALACDPKKQDTTTAVIEKTPEVSTPADLTTSYPTWDNVDWKVIDKIPPTEKVVYEVDSLKTVKMCAQRQPRGKKRMRITVEFRPLTGDAFNIYSGEISPGSQFYFEYLPMVNGEVIIRVQERKLFWDRLRLVSTDQPVTCWPPKFEFKKMRAPITVKTTDSSNTTTTVSIEQ